MSGSLREQNQTEPPRDGSPLSVLAAQIEAVLFLASSPVSERELSSLFDVPAPVLSAALKELDGKLKSGGHGLVLKTAAGGWFMATNPHFAEVLSRFRDAAQRGRVHLSRAAVETAAIIAYNQPVTRSEIEELRGIRSDGIVTRLLNYGLIRLAGRKKGSGSPLLYRTTPRFLELFGLNAIADLPSLEELSEMGAGPVIAPVRSENEAEEKSKKEEEREEQEEQGAREERPEENET